MTFYRYLTRLAERLDARAFLFRHGFNFSPMYRRTTARLIYVSDDLHTIRIRLPISWRNRNYLGSIFGGSMAAATDPIAMVQLINILADAYTIWDKAGEIRFRRPAREDLYAEFTYTPDELQQLRATVAERGETDITKEIQLTDQTGTTVYAEVRRTIYVADRAYHREKRRAKLGGAAGGGR